MLRAAFVPVLLLLMVVVPGHGQELRLKRDVPPIAWGGCPAVPAVTPPDEDRAQADRLAGAAAQAAILGDDADVLRLLDEAASLDASSASIAYHHARALAGAGRVVEAVSAYCRFLSLAPGSPDAEEVRSRITSLLPGDGAMPEPAVRSFREGLAAFDAGRLAEADAAFGRAAEAAPAWPAPIYNRAAARVLSGSLAPAGSDLRSYLELSPGAADFEEVLDVVSVIRAAQPRSPTNALVAGLFVPGLGQFTTDRPGAGLLVLGASGGALAAAFLVEKTDVDCLALPVDGQCPPGQVLRERSERPLLVPGIAAAAAITLAGAIEAWHAVRRSNRPAAGPIRVVGDAGHDASRGLVFAGPGLHIARDGARLDLIRIRF
jgi:hypothetical protein